jgi:drug/metabolite transporter (DMT)-like permease
LLDTGWSPGAAVLARVTVAAVVVLPFGLAALRGRWGLLLRRWRLLLLYGLGPVAGAQFAYFCAIASMDVAPALLIEYTAPAAVVGYLWLRHRQRPSRLTVAGAAVAAAGLVLVLGLLAGADLAWAGVAWALVAMTGAAAYFVLNADTGTGLPPITLAGAGLAVGGLLLGALAAVGLLPMRVTGGTALYAGRPVAWWLPVLALGLLTAGFAFVAGIAAGRRLGSQLASFVSLLEVVFAVGFAWVLLGQVPGPWQLAGGVLIVAGVVVVKLGERGSGGR